MTVMTETKPTKNQTISVQQAIDILRARKLRLYAHQTDGRFIYRVVDQNGNHTSASSRLERAVAIAAGSVPA